MLRIMPCHGAIACEHVNLSEISERFVDIHVLPRCSRGLVDPVATIPMFGPVIPRGRLRGSGGDSIGITYLHHPWSRPHLRANQRTTAIHEWPSDQARCAGCDTTVPLYLHTCDQAICTHR
jgi:hypothetical protein